MPQCRIRRCQFGIRTLLLAVLVLSVLLSWFGMNLRKGRLQAEAVNAIENKGGTVIYEPCAETTIAVFCQELLGDDFVLDVTEVVAPNAFSDADAMYLKRFKRLKRLRLSCTGITDAGLEHIKGLNNLSELHLNFTRISNIGLKNLEGLTNLEKLDLCCEEIGDLGLEHLKDLDSLKRLNLNFTRISDAGLEHLEGMTRLERLQINLTRVTVEGKRELQEALPDCKIDCNASWGDQLTGDRGACGSAPSGKP